MARAEWEVGTFEAKNRLSELLQEAAAGQRIWITRHGKRVALLSDGRETDTGPTTSLVSTFREVRASTRPGPESTGELIGEGRR